jgi:hypothetical protein
VTTDTGSPTAPTRAQPAGRHKTAEANHLPVDRITEVRVLDPHFYHGGDETMNRHVSTGATAALLVATLLTGCSNGEDDNATPQTDPTHQPAAEAAAFDVTPKLAADVATMRAATADYANDLDAALADGYFIITQMIDDMGYHFLNPNVEGFDPNQPPILVYARDGDDWQLVAFEWVFPAQPDQPPMDGATYGDFPAACHYDDGLFEVEPDEDQCAQTHPDSGAGFTFWHPDLVTMHAWVWMHNPDGFYHGTNPLMSPYND